MSPKVWLITGTSSGFGALLTKAALKNGDKVIATARDPRKIEDLKALGAATMALDVTDQEEKIKKVIADAISIYGQIDILVNNAGYILEGTIEESSVDEASKLFETNVFGPIKVLSALLPHMRERKSGVIANMGSIAGWLGYNGAGLYCSSKFAIAGMSESLRFEVEPFGIEVVTIDPGYFRTNFLAPGHRVQNATRIADYDPVMESTRNSLNAYDRKQPGDPEKGSQLIVEILTKSGRAAGKTLPPHIPLGSDAITTIGNKCRETLNVLAEWETLSCSTDHNDTKQ